MMHSLEGYILITPEMPAIDIPSKMAEMGMSGVFVISNNKFFGTITYHYLVRFAYTRYSFRS